MMSPGHSSNGMSRLEQYYQKLNQSVAKIQQDQSMVAAETKNVEPKSNKKMR